MPGQTADELLSLFDRAPLNRRYWVSFMLLSALFVLEFFDFLVVGYLLAVLGPQWHLTYGQSALILYSGGIGSILGALFFGGLADAWGRKSQMIIGTFICAIAAGLIGLVPAGAWQIFAVLRFFVGVGLTAGVTPSLTILVELTPTRNRTLLTSFYIVFASAGGLLASTTSAALLAALGWRGVAMLGVSPAIVGILIWFLVPESVRWLVAKGRFAEARAVVAKHLDLPLRRVPLPTIAPTSPPRGKLSELYHHPRMFWETILIWGGSSTAGYGVYLWGPTIVALALGVSVPKAAAYFVFVALGGVGGKIVVTFLAPLIGRRPLGVIWGIGGVVTLAAAGYYHAVVLGGLPLMVILLCASTFFIEGGFSNLAPYTVESYGVNLGARASGLGQAANGVGKILGPLSLALIAGSSNVVSPQATADAVFPAYLFLAFCMALVALSFLVLGVETHGKAMAFAADEMPAPARQTALGTPTR
ncbi:MAG: MFS transporter [Alphaproteobacteria bacterium]|nr:MFS transporter [Alphaproteobacteria bacterium]